MEVLESPRLIYRPFEASDLMLLHEFHSEPEVSASYRLPSPLPIEDTQWWLNKTLMSYQTDGIGHYAIFLKDNNEFIGRCGLRILEVEKFPTDDRPKWFWYRDSAPEGLNVERYLELGYGYKYKFWGKGYATEAGKMFCKYAFENKLADEIHAAIFTDNLASGRVLEKVGFKKYGKAYALGEELITFVLKK